TEYSLFARGSEELFPVVTGLGIGVVAYSPLARGFLSGAVRPRSAYVADDFRQHVSWWAPESFEANIAIVDALSEFAVEKQMTLAQLALAWALARREDIVPIPGSRNPDRVAENVAAATLVLTDTDLDRIAELVPTG